MSPLLRAPAESGRVYLTFDDGPDPQWTPRVLYLLAQHGVRATFFVIGRAARDAPGIVRRIAAAGHDVENHSWSHRHPWTMSASAARREVCDGAAAVSDLVGRAPRYFRPPHGRLRRCMSEAAQEGGQRIALWSVSAVDWGPLGHAQRIAARLGRVRGGDIVLMHDSARGINRPRELERLLPGFLQALSSRGLEPVPLGALLEGSGAS